MIPMPHDTALTRDEARDFKLLRETLDAAVVSAPENTDHRHVRVVVCTLNGLGDVVPMARRLAYEVLREWLA